jgi:hypothetical protein
LQLGGLTSVNKNRVKELGRDKSTPGGETSDRRYQRYQRRTDVTDVTDVLAILCTRPGQMGSVCLIEFSADITRARD